jgi:hypothetical protein
MLRHDIGQDGELGSLVPGVVSFAVLNISSCIEELDLKKMFMVSEIKRGLYDIAQEPRCS